MRTKSITVAAFLLSGLFTVLTARATDITAINSGTWGDPGVWQGGTVPGTNDDADIPAGITVTVTTNAAVQFIYDDGTVTLSPGATLWIVGDANGANGTSQLGSLNATNAGCTVLYTGNPFWAKQTNYFNLIFANTNYVPPAPPFVIYQNFNNFSSAQGPTPMTIGGNMTVIGHTRVQQGSGGAPITILGNLTIGAGCAWDSSGDNLTVVSNLLITGGLMEDLNGALGSNYFGGNVSISGPSNSVLSFVGGPYTNGWFVSDVTTWGVGGNLTNNGSIFGSGYGSITFAGTGVVTGSNALTLPTISVDGSYEITIPITLITNTPSLNGTLTFDLAKPAQIVLLTNAGTALFYSGDLNVINSGPAPATGASYQLFVSTNGFGGGFNNTTFPPLPAGLSWIDNTVTTGSIDVTGTAIGSPRLTISKSGGNVILSWDSTTFPGYRVQAQTNNGAGGLTTSWGATGSGTVSPFTIGIATNKSVYFRLINP